MKLGRWLCCGLLAVLAGDTAAVELARDCLPEPVFDGKVCFHEANAEGAATVVLVHGIGGSADDWAAQIPWLAGHYHVLAIDLPGFGRSDGGTKHYSPENYAAVLEYVIGQRADGPVLLVGHSLGGAVALNYAALHPERVSRLVVVAVSGILHRLAYNKFLVGNWLHGRNASSRWSSEWVQSLVGKILEEAERFPFDSEDMLNSAYGEGHGAEQRIAAMALLDADFSPLLPRVSAPVLILWGSADRVAPLRTGHVLLRRLQHARLEIIEGAGHVPAREQPEVFKRLLLNFLQGSLPQTPAAPEVLPGDGERVGRCEQQRNLKFQGRYRRLELHGCSDVIIADADIGELYIHESRVNIEHSRIGGGALAVDVIGSDVKMTAVRLEGDVTLRLARSRIDFAAVDLEARLAAVTAVSDSKAVFSLCLVNSPHHEGDLHGYREVTPESLL